MLTESLQHNICLAEKSQGQVTTKKNTTKTMGKTVIATPRPDGGVKKLK